jgi:hypothetical protein
MTSIGNPTTSVSNQLEPKYGNLDEGTQTTDGKKKKRGSPCEAICNQNKALWRLSIRRHPKILWANVEAAINRIGVLPLGRCGIGSFHRMDITCRMKESDE